MSWKSLKKMFGFKQMFLHIFLMIVAIIFLSPVIWMISASLKSNQELWDSTIGIIPPVLRFENYIRAWNVSHFSNYFFNTVVYTAGVIIIVLSIGITSGYIFSRFNFPFKKIILTLIVSTMLVPQASQMIPLFMVIQNLGLLNSRLGYTLASGSGCAMSILLFSSFIKNLPRELEEAAEMDGCSFIQMFWYIVIPSVKPVIATVAILNGVFTWKQFLIPLIFTLNKPGLRTIGVGMFAFVGEYSTDWTGMAAVACISLLPLLALFLVFQRYFVEGLSGALKN